MSYQENRELIETLANCIAACEHCADACLSEDDPSKLAKCIRLDRDCTDICKLTISFIARNSEYAPGIVDECIEICEECAEECEKHDHDHCIECAEACRKCVEACEDY